MIVELFKNTSTNIPGTLKLNRVFKNLHYHQPIAKEKQIKQLKLDYHSIKQDRIKQEESIEKLRKDI